MRKEEEKENKNSRIIILFKGFPGRIGRERRLETKEAYTLVITERKNQKKGSCVSSSL